MPDDRASVDGRHHAYHPGPEGTPDQPATGTAVTILRWYRSWPEPGDRAFWKGTDRAHVIDSLPKLCMSGYDYFTALLPDDEPGFCLLEWDMALSRTERRDFAIAAARMPGRILVAPYDIYPTVGDECVHRHENGAPIGMGWPVAATFGLGCIYIPQHVLQAFQRASGETVMTDATFSRFVFHQYGPTTVDWRFHPQHLNGD
jgi:hypothetical protein